METLEFDGLTAATFSVDSERRTMRGVVIPWGKIGRHSNGNRWRFLRGSLKYGHEKYIKLNEEHVQSARFGRAIATEDTDEGFVVTFKVYDGPHGDRALAMARDGMKTGLSPEVDIDTLDMQNDPENPGVKLVTMANLTAVGFVKNPAFDDSRLISVVASYEGASMKCTKCGLVHADGVTECVTPPANTPPTNAQAAQSVTFSAEQFKELMAKVDSAGRPIHPNVSPVRVENGDGTVSYVYSADQGPTITDPTARPVVSTQVTEPLPYAFSRTGTGKYTFRADTEHDFSSDLLEMLKLQTSGGDYGPQVGRLNDFIKQTFADVEIADLPGSVVSQRRPDMWVPQRDYATPLWDLTGRGAPPNGGSKFDIPKFTSSSGLVSVATEKTEPAGGSFVDEMQTITPGQLWGKVEITRQVWRQGGNPAFSGILWSQMLREFYEDREAAIATFLATLTAATDIALTGTDASPSNDEYRATIESFEQAYADLQFVRGGNRFNAFAVHQALYRVASRVKDGNGRPMYPMINPENANGTTASKYRTIDIAGSTWVPAYALGAPANASTNSWLFDSDVVLAWAGAPERLEWNFGATVQTANIPQLSFVTVGLYADYAVGNTDISGVRQVTFDPNTEA